VSRRLISLFVVAGLALFVATALGLATGAVDARRAPTVKLVVVKTGDGSVRSNNGAISCGRRCVARFPRGKLVGLVAKGMLSDAFVGWGGACVGSSPGCVLAMDKSRRVRATFGSLPPFVLLTVGGGGTVTSNPPGVMCGSSGGVCAAPFAVGSAFALSPKPDPGYEFLGWSGACSEAETSPCTLHTDKLALSVTATFRRAGGPIGDARLSVVGGSSEFKLRSSPPGIDCPPTCTASFAPGSVVTLEGFQFGAEFFREWSGACVGTVARCRVVVDGPLEVRVRTLVGFGGPPARLGVNVTVSGRGTVTDGQLIRCGQQARSIRDCRAFFQGGQVVALRAVPARGARFVGWAGFCKGRGRCTLQVVRAMHVHGLFRG
jgi:hypothetical protein